MQQKIHMVDLLGQYQKIKPEVDTALQQVIDRAAFILMCRMQLPGC